MQFNKKILLILLTIIPCELYSQRYRHLDDYEEYFYRNINTIDISIEGIWRSFEVVYLNDQNAGEMEYFVVIIKEGNEFRQYRFENNGNFRPYQWRESYSKTGNSYYFERVSNTFNASLSSRVIVSSNRLTMVIDTKSLLVAQNFTPGSTGTNRIEMQRIYPLEADISKQRSTHVNSSISNSVSSFRRFLGMSREAVKESAANCVIDDKPLTMSITCGRESYLFGLRNNYTFSLMYRSPDPNDLLEIHSREINYFQQEGWEQKYYNVDQVGNVEYKYQKGEYCINAHFITMLWFSIQLCSD